MKNISKIINISLLIFLSKFVKLKLVLLSKSEIALDEFELKEKGSILTKLKLIPSFDYFNFVISSSKISMVISVFDINIFIIVV